MMTNFLRALTLGVVVVFAGSAAVDAAAPPVLERVVLVTRHGVRSPTRSDAEMASYAQEAWPQWPVAPGELTPHGAEALTRMGEGLKAHYATLLGQSCDFYIWSDSADSRTRASGEAVARGLAPACAGRSGHGKEGSADVLFDAIDADRCPIEPQKAVDAVNARLKSVLSRNAASYARARATLQTILTPGAKGPCADDKEKICRIAGGDNRVSASKTDVKLEGPLNLGSTLSEVLLLQYGQGMTPGWGRADKAKIATALDLHNLYSDVMRRNPVLASRRGSHLVRAILNTLEGKPDSALAAAKVPGDTKMLIFLGHDTNLANLSGLVDAAWTLPGQPDVTAPDTSLAFEVWRDAMGQRTVAVRVFYQTMDQLRDLTGFDAGHPLPSQALTLANCKGAACTLDAFRARMTPKLAADCLEAR